ncbi:hypothetical protein RvY_18499 [Ramazzottius varieornatus]|uniref:Large ribosomal subunit protein bL21m n=1 Tax=Ramazzottius varieornatus TaxID=947166 RepID=A0A1D1W614_RAMVA|nr:hypothetical protein RvY_18499 [Ramazzottius varieornatus]
MSLAPSMARILAQHPSRCWRQCLSQVGKSLIAPSFSSPRLSQTCRSYGRAWRPPPRMLLPEKLLKSPPAQVAPADQEEIQFTEMLGDPQLNPFNPKILPEEIQYGDPVEGLEPHEARIHNEVTERINNQITEGSHGRLFAVVFLSGRQYRVTDEDIIMITGVYHVQTGERIRMEKVLAVGCSDFTLLGRPLLDRGFVNVEATVIEKTLSYPIIRFKHLRKIPLRTTRFNREPQTLIRINSVSFGRRLNEQADSQDVVRNIS